ncbi:hypothetical protein C0416_02090 [bacterium]|nr:hypothetical protein [bacterium]
MNSFAIIIRYKNSETAVLNAAYNPDGSFQITDLITKHIENPEYEIGTFDMPVNKVGREKTIEANKTRYFTNNRIVINHHVSGKIHVKGEKKGAIIQGFDTETGLPKGVGLIDGFDLINDTNDGYQFLGGVFWGLNKVPKYISKTSEKIIFSDEEVNYQTMRNTGSKLAFTVLFFHLPLPKVSDEELKNGCMYYSLENFIRPLFLKILKPEKNYSFVVGVTCMKSRINNDNEFGCHLLAGATKINPETGTCKNIAIFYPSYRGEKTENYYSLNFEQEE